MNWKLKSVLDDNQLKAIDLVRQTELSTNTIYPIVRNEAQRVDRETLGVIILALRELTKKEIQVSDILVFE